MLTIFKNLCLFLIFTNYQKFYVCFKSSKNSAILCFQLKLAILSNSMFFHKQNFKNSMFLLELEKSEILCFLNLAGLQKCLLIIKASRTSEVLCFFNQQNFGNSMFLFKMVELQKVYVFLKFSRTSEILCFNMIF